AFQRGPLPAWPLLIAAVQTCNSAKSEENMDVTKDQFNELLLQMLETEQGGVKVYETALRCVLNEDLKKEWEKYLSQTTQHVEVVTALIDHFGGDPNT